jgi:hypothetical protein
MTWRSDRWIDERAEKLRLLGTEIPPIRIEAVKQADGSTLYAVRQANACLALDGTWFYESTPSEETRWLVHGCEAFRKACRFPTWEQAALAVDKQPPAGRFAAGSVVNFWQESR